MKTNRQKIASVLDELVITSPTTFTWYGESNGFLPTDVLNAIDASTARQHLVNEIKERLYRSFYGFGFPFADRDDAEGFGYAGDPNFQQQLSTANHGKGCWTTGWNVTAIEKQIVIVERNGLAFEAGPDEVRPVNANAAIYVGDRVQVLTPKEQLGMSPGHYLVQSNVEIHKEDPRVRIYWNISPHGAAPLTSEITRRLNDLAIPFRYKVMNDPGRFLRCDVAVLYLRQQDFTEVASSLRAIIVSMLPYLRAGVPAFTRQIADGVGFAEDPETRESFGLHRCDLLAEAIVGGWENGLMEQDASRELAVDYIAEHFANAGHDLERAYLNPGSNDVYEIAPTKDASTVRISRLKDRSPSSSTTTTINPSKLLRTAHAIGRTIADQAIWHKDRCTWVGPDEVANESSGRSLAHFTTLDSTIYLGNAGVALFLAELVSRTDDDRLRATAIGAARQALYQVGGDNADHRSGLYCGWTGVAYSTAKVASLLDDDSLFESSRQLIEDHAAKLVLNHGEFDIVSGVAGGILGLLSVSDLRNADAQRKLAERFSERLVSSAESDGKASSWSSVDQTEHNLLGYSHGASGIAHALIALHDKTGEPLLLDYARQAIQFERRHYNREQQNWPDFRHPDGPLSERYMCAWCHGAAGVAVSRAVASKHRIDPLVDDELAAAISTTAQSVRRWLATDDPATSLCHSGMGNAEILAACDQIVPGCASKHSSLVDEVTSRVVVRLNQSDPIAQLLVLGPGLMLGLSGIGHYLLRRFDSRVASILAPATIPHQSIAPPGDNDVLINSQRSCELGRTSCQMKALGADTYLAVQPPSTVTRLPVM